MLETADYAVVAIYLLAITAFGSWFSRFQLTTADYFLTRRSVPWWGVCFTIVATETSTLSFIGVPATAFTGNFTFLQLAVGYVIGRVIVSVIFVPAYFRGDLMTSYELLQRRFGPIVKTASAGTFLITRSLADGIRLFATALVITAVTGAAATALMCGGFTEYLSTGRLPPRQGSQNSLLSPAGAFEVAGGRYITIAVLRDSHWAKFCAALGLDRLAADNRFDSNAGRVQHRAELHEVIVPLLKSQPAEYWLERLRKADILCGPINTVADVLADPVLKACLPLLDIGLPNAAQAMGAPIRYNSEFFGVSRPAPAKGQHTREVLAELGYAAQDIENFLSAGSVFAEAG